MNVIADFATDGLQKDSNGRLRTLGRFYTCTKHSWDSAGQPCPKCKKGDAPRHCAKHGWSHTSKPCPSCTEGR